jgi:hypothetical protein
VTVTYQQRYIRSSSLRVPKELRITITGPDGGEVPIKRGLPSKASSAKGDFARQTIGSITVPTAGEYTVHTEPLSGPGGESRAFVLFGDVP